jgi:hypothetical protein
MPARASRGNGWVFPRSSSRFPLGSRLITRPGEFDLAQRLDEDLLRLSHQRTDVAELVLGHYSSGRNLMFAGRFVSSRSHLEEALALYNPIAHHSLAHQVGLPPTWHQRRIWESSFSVSAIRTKHSHGATQPSLRLAARRAVMSR